MDLLYKIAIKALGGYIVICTDIQAKAKSSLLPFDNIGSL